MGASPIKLSPQERIARAQALYAALNAGNLDRAAEYLSDDLVFHSPVFPQPVGKGALVAASQRIVDATDEYTLEIHDILANDQHVVAVFVVRGRRGERVLNERGVHVLHLDDEGKVAELWAVTDPKPHLALWGDS